MTKSFFICILEYTGILNKRKLGYFSVISIFLPLLSCVGGKPPQDQDYKFSENIAEYRLQYPGMALSGKAYPEKDSGYVNKVHPERILPISSMPRLIPFILRIQPSRRARALEYKSIPGKTRAERNPFSTKPEESLTISRFISTIISQFTGCGLATFSADLKLFGFLVKQKKNLVMLSWYRIKSNFPNKPKSLINNYLRPLAS